MNDTVATKEESEERNAAEDKLAESSGFHPEESGSYPDGSTMEYTYTAEFTQDEFENVIKALKEQESTEELQWPQFDNMITLGHSPRQPQPLTWEDTAMS